MPKTIKAIETEYKGYKFRSRLEARWAVFFEALGFDWEYEPEGFELSNGQWYLPDFRVKSIHGFTTWYEIKPKDSVDDNKIKQLGKDFHKKYYQFSNFLVETNLKIKKLKNPTGVTLTKNGSVLPDSCVCLPGDPGNLLINDGSKYSACPRCGLINIHQSLNYPKKPGDEFYLGCSRCDFDTPHGASQETHLGDICHCEPHKGLLMINYYFWGMYEHRLQEAIKKSRSARFEHGQIPDDKIDKTLSQKLRSARKQLYKRRPGLTQ